MIEFLNEAVRQEFHLLPLDRQREFMGMGQALFRHDQTLVVLHVERISATTSEVTVRIDTKAHDRAV